MGGGGGGGLLVEGEVRGRRGRSDGGDCGVTDGAVVLRNRESGDGFGVCSCCRHFGFCFERERC